MTDIEGIDMTERRRQERLILDESSFLRWQGVPCFLVDASPRGLGITFISDSGWPESLTLEYVLPGESGRNGIVQCRTVWERSIDFVSIGLSETVRRRGLAFEEPGSVNTGLFLEHLSGLEGWN